MVTLHYPGPWGSTIIIRIPFGRNRPEPDWEALVSDLAFLGPSHGEPDDRLHEVADELDEVGDLLRDF